MNWRYLFTSFEGRINRRPYWIASLIVLAIALVAGVILGILVVVTVGEDETALAIASLVLQLVVLYPALALTVKRLHDRDRPNWWAAIIFVPTVLSAVLGVFGMDVYGPSQSMIAIIVNVVLVIVSIWFLIELGFLRGTPGPNRYGPDPLAAQPAAAD
jgi:uncharacterized membrane protein YhaH (DUF805 family)